MSYIDRTSEKLYRKSIAILSDEELSKEIWVLDEHIRYLQKEDDQTASSMCELLSVALEERERRAFNRGYV